MSDYWLWWIAATILVGAELVTGTFYLLALGVAFAFGGIAAWLKQHKWRMRARRAEAEARDLRVRLDSGESRRNLPAVVEASPPFIVPPAA